MSHTQTHPHTHTHARARAHTHSYLSILPDDKAVIFAASLLISYCIFSSLILSSIVMIKFYIASERWHLKRKRSSDGKVVSLTKKEFGFAVHF